MVQRSMADKAGYRGGTPQSDYPAMKIARSRERHASIILTFISLIRIIPAENIWLQAQGEHMRGPPANQEGTWGRPASAAVLAGAFPWSSARTKGPSLRGWPFRR